jgi:CMP-N,N'-diacetyllegionaminic acid synthase
MKMKTVAFIPARGGSKGVPGKNKKIFAGKPLVQWSIEQAAASKLFDHIIVSSDDDDILQIAKDCKKMKVVPVERHAELSNDTADLDDVLYDFFGRPKNECEHVCVLPPTSPLRSPEDIIKTYKYIKMKKYWAVVSVKWTDMIGWVDNVSNKGALPTYNVEKRPTRQTRKDYFLENGAIYWFQNRVFKVYGHMISNYRKVKLYEMPLERSLEIDTPFDFFIAEKAVGWEDK